MDFRVPTGPRYKAIVVVDSPPGWASQLPSKPGPQASTQKWGAFSAGRAGWEISRCSNQFSSRNSLNMKLPGWRFSTTMTESMYDSGFETGDLFIVWSWKVLELLFKAWKSNPQPPQFSSSGSFWWISEILAFFWKTERLKQSGWQRKYGCKVHIMEICMCIYIYSVPQYLCWSAFECYQALNHHKDLNQSSMNLHIYTKKKRFFYGFSFHMTIR